MEPRFTVSVRCQQGLRRPASRSAAPDRTVRPMLLFSRTTRMMRPQQQSGSGAAPGLVRTTTTNPPRSVPSRGPLSSSSTSSLLLPPPTFLFSNNHLLVVNKPPGWCSSPSKNVVAGTNRNDAPPSQDSSNSKCLLTYLQAQRLGGGSLRKFLKPVHRIDQPCSGVQLYAKTTRAASKIQSQWRERVRKTYVAVLASSEDLSRLVKAATMMESVKPDPTTSAVDDDRPHAVTEAPSWFELHAYLDRRPTRRLQQKQKLASSSVTSTPKGWSVTMIPVTNQDSDRDGRFLDETRYRRCAVKFTIVCPERGWIRIETRDGSRHVIRALLACHGAPLAGDARYGGSVEAGRRRLRLLLPDRSVALHAERIEMILRPTSSLSGRNTLLDNLRGPFVAPIPLTWIEWFGIPDALRPGR